MHSLWSKLNPDNNVFWYRLKILRWKWYPKPILWCILPDLSQFFYHNHICLSKFLFVTRRQQSSFFHKVHWYHSHWPNHCPIVSTTSFSWEHMNICLQQTQLISFFKRVYLFSERGREGERQGEKHKWVVASHVPPLGTWPTTQAHALDWESNPQPFGLQAGAQSTGPHQPRPHLISIQI